METNPDHRQIHLRPPEEVMRLSRMGCFHQTRLSFMRALLRMLKDRRWKFHRELWRIDGNGVGTAVYCATGNGRTYSLVCFANDLPAEKRSDRVIAEEWDATFVLFDGIPDQEDLARLEQNVPKQEAGHCSERELVLSRANRSIRLFEHVVDMLSRGGQPDPEMIDKVGYLMRTTAVYGNGKFGISDRERISGRQEFAGPFRAEMLAVWLIRWFTIDIVEHLARVRGGDTAVPMEPNLRRQLGVGNATGLGMAPFLMLHPALIHCWILARETALVRVRAVETANRVAREEFKSLVSRMASGLPYWITSDPRQQSRIEGLQSDLDAVSRFVMDGGLESDYPWDRLVEWSRDALTMEGQELVVSLVLEPYGDLVDDLADQMGIDESRSFRIDGSRKAGELLHCMECHYPWALEIDFSEDAAQSRFWYVSEEKLEPRLGERFEEPGAELEHPLAFGRDVQSAHRDLVAYASREGRDRPIAEFLLRHPEHRHTLRRVQIVEQFPYAEIRDNLISGEMVPIDLLRCKLSFFGASRFDPKSDRWVRITMFQYAPHPDELEAMEADDWIYPPETG